MRTKIQRHVGWGYNNNLVAIVKYIICISKCDFDIDEDNSDIFENKDYIYISSFTKYGIDKLKDTIFSPT